MRAIRPPRRYATIRCDPAAFQRRSGAQRNFKSLRQNREGD